MVKVGLIWFKFVDKVLASNSKGDRRILTMSLAGHYYFITITSANLSHIDDLYKIKSEVTGV